MKISVLIIAHNEELYIAKCIESVLNQNQKPDEIVLIAHNCTDKTIEIAEKYPITTINFKGEPGIVSARLEGMKHISGDMVICIDGDSFAPANWVEVMSKTLQSNNNILVGSHVKFKGTVFGNLLNMSFKYLCVSKKIKPSNWIWGVSFAFWKKDTNLIEKYLKESLIVIKKIKLSRNPDDYFVALLMSKKGNIEVTNKTFVTQNTKENDSLKMISRIVENSKDVKLVEDYFGNNPNI